MRNEQIGDCTLYLGDCLTVMRQIANVDAVLTDPPYGIRADENPVRGVHRYTKTSWDRDRPEPAVFQEILKIAPQQIIWGGNYFADLLPPSMRWLIWDKGTRDFSLADCELAWTSQSRAARIFSYSRAKANQDGKQHPTQKPLALMRWCLEFIKDAEVVLDPFMGSGTTGVACAKAGRKFVGIEINEEYFNVACERIRKAYAQPDMFIASPVNDNTKPISLFDTPANAA